MDLHWIPPASRLAFQGDRPLPPSPSRSPHKRQISAEKIDDSLLSNLSLPPTLDAVQAPTTDLLLQDAFRESIAVASLSDKAVAVRAATARTRLKEWHEELERWHWQSHQNPFELPSVQASPDAEHGAAFAREYWGSLSKQTVLQYEDRIDEIRDAMDALELNALKVYVRDAHSTTSHHLMDDITAIVTTTIMQALPLIYRLEALLAVWDSRLAVLRASLGFTNTMDRAQQEMIAAWSFLDSNHAKDNEEVTTQALHGVRASLESQIRDLGHRLDYMLDTLEGRQDTIPDRWIDNMEQLEAEFGDWTVGAETAIVHLKMRSVDNLRSQKEPIKSPTQVRQTEDSCSLSPPMNEPSHSSIDDASDTRDGILSRNGHRPLPLDLRQHRRDLSNAYSDASNLSYPGSSTSDYFSDMSSPEIRDASRAEYFDVGSPIEVSTPGLPRRESRTSEDTITRQSSQRTERDDIPTLNRASTIAEPTIEEHGGPALIATNGLGLVDRPMLTGFEEQNAITPVPAEPRHRFEEVSDLSPSSTPVKIIRTKSAAEAAITPNRVATTSPMKSLEDALEARITSILTDIPTNIRLARSTEDIATEMVPSLAKLDTRTTRKSPTPRLMRAQTVAPSPPAMTLIPADPKTKRARNGGCDVQLYHLHQSDQSPPVKLFVRLVGEGERVMVRIGGGWADLAEYLKEYAIHHGRRTVSGGQFDIQGLPHPQSSSPVTTLGSLSNNQTPERTTTAAEFSSLYGTPADRFRPTSRDSTASSKNSWTGDESPSLGLAGQKSRKAAVSPNKQAWVDTMIEKARNGSSEQKKGARDGFGDMGIIGGTKRLFMRKAT
ncbi:MAG: hypothetical protein Q9172_005317 [Xanthocarpia lactea]